MSECCGQLCLEGGYEFATRGGRRIYRARAADEDDAGGERIGISAAHPVSHLCPHRPCASGGEAGANHRIEKCLPARACGTVAAVALSLLKSVINGDREG